MNKTKTKKTKYGTTTITDNNGSCTSTVHTPFLLKFDSVTWHENRIRVIHPEW